MSVTDFLAHLEVERRVSAHTLDAYRRDLAALTEWAQAQHITDLAGVQPEQLRGFGHIPDLDQFADLCGGNDAARVTQGRQHFHTIAEL